MRHLLQHRWWAAALIPVAAAVGGWAVGLLVSRPAQSDERSQAMPALVQPTVPWWNEPSTRSPGGRDPITIHPLRDPFDESVRVPSAGSPDPWMGFDSLRLGATLCRPGDPLAVIDGHVVRPGDRVAGFEVAHCGPDAVWITGPGGSRRLGFQPRTNPKPARPRS